MLKEKLKLGEKNNSALPCQLCYAKKKKNPWTFGRNCYKHNTKRHAHFSLVPITGRLTKLTTTKK